MVASAQGKDFSSYQGVITPEALKGLSFAYTRVSSWSGAAMGTDVNFTRNWAAIKAAGLHRKAYWFFQPLLSPVSQAAYFAAKVKAAGLFPGDGLVCDSETLTAGVDAATLAFQRHVQALTGWPVELIETYTDLDVGKHLVATSQEFPTLWIGWPSPTAPVPAQWAPAKWKDWTFWQFGTSLGVDADAFNGTAAELDAWVASHVPGAQAPAAVTVTADGKLSLAEIADAHKTQCSAILRATAVADGKYPPAVARWLNAVLTGTTLPLAPVPAGTVFHLPL